MSMRHSSGSAQGPLKILVVCTGNICRSPMAAGFIEHHLRLGGMEDRAVQSRGTHAVEGHRAVKESLEAAAERGVDIAHHRAAMFTAADAVWADVILVMERYHADLVAEQFGASASEKTRLFGSYAGLVEIDDPFGADPGKFRRVATQIWDAARAFVTSIKA